ncbi:MAG: SurA N-terminal domain-containing protein [Rhizobiales bacterium]|nr:SurA N-terminal domain-containing protein [Hyphomicrobiales bacterium]
MTNRAIRRFCVLLCLGLLTTSTVHFARAEGLGVVAIVNDVPITEFDVGQRISLMKILGDLPEGEEPRKKALQSLVDDVIKLAEAKRLNMSSTDADINKQVARVAGGLKTTPDALIKQLAEKGIGADTFRRYIAAQTGFNRIIASKYRNDIAIKPADIDRKFADIQQKVDTQMEAIKKDPRMKPVTVYTIMEINLPVEGNDTQLLQARLVEAVQVAKQFKSCKNAKAAARGVFNVKFDKAMDADASKLPKQIKAALDKAGPGKAIGPMRAKNGIQLLAYCGARKITPQMPKFELPTRQQVENVLVNEKFDTFEETYMKDARSKIYVEYRSPGYTQ